MPSTRAGAGRSKTTEESTSSSDWSMHTPSENASESTTSASEASRSTHKMSPPPDANSRLAEDAAVKESSGKATSTAPHTTRTIETIEVSSHARQEESHPIQQNPERSVAVKLRRVEGSTPTSIEGSLQRPPHAKKPTRDTDTQSVRSSHRRKAEAQAKLAVALREMELAEARTRVAQAELELAAAESEEEDGAELYERTREVENWFIETGVGPTKDQRPAEIQEKRSDIQELAQVIMKLSEKSRDIITPRHVELPYFNGSCDEWLAFKRSYEDSAVSYSNVQNLARLRRAIQGTAKEAVQSLLFTAEEPREVIKCLESRFGRPGALALAELDKMKNLSKVGENPSDICVFASKVKNAVETIKALKKPQYLSSPETLKAVVDKMPTSMKFRWFAYHRSRRDEEVQELLLIEAFLEIEADMCGDFAPPEVSSEHKKVYRKPVHTVQEVSKETYKKSCPTCEEEHFAIECKRFRDANIDEKWNIIKKARICFKCLRFKHSRLNCKAPVCKQCGRWHHTILHSDKPPVSIGKQVNKEGGASEETVATINNAKGEEKAYLKVIPVDLYGPKGHVRVLALLDEGSTITLLDASIAEQIGAKGNLERLTIETVGGKLIRKDSSQKIELRIKGAHRSDKRTIIARTIDDLKLSEQTLNKDTVRNCQHLRAIEHQILYVTERPKLLIGQDNWGLIVTRKLRKGKPSEPVASLTNLGWVLHGCESGANALVNFTHYGRATESEESVEEIVREHFQLESLGIQNRSPSNDSDRRALEILEKTTKRLASGQFETGLLWRREDESLPNNYKHALRRLFNLEKKLDQDKEKQDSYKTQINNLIGKGYAELAPVKASEGRLFYLPHFAILHPIKKKPRIVFDAAAKYEGKSLNDALLSGPDLLQSLFGVLLRFREGPVVVMADIQEMFLRVKVREDGLRWLVKEDMLAFNVGLRNTSKKLLNGERAPTKREVTSAVMSTFDPMGFATPVLIQGKKLIQDIWRTQIGWDDSNNESQQDTWMKYLGKVSTLTKLKIPRCISPRTTKGQLHTFTDASEEAYAAAVYWRTVVPDGSVHISLIAGKARVTPTKPVSIPRLELQAALLGSRLSAAIQDEMELDVSNKTSDSNKTTYSSTVLQWIRAEPKKF